MYYDGVDLHFDFNSITQASGYDCSNKTKHFIDKGLKKNTKNL